MMNKNKTTRFNDSEELLSIRLAAPMFELADTAAPQAIDCESTNIFIADLLDLGFIFSHELSIHNAVGKEEGESATMLAYLNAAEQAYALITDLYHNDNWVQFTSFLPEGTRFVTTSQPGAMSLEVKNADVRITNVGSTPLQSQWKKHKRLIATEVPETLPILLQPEQHIAVEESFYAQFIEQLLSDNVLQPSDTQTMRFTRSGARTFHLSLTSRSARRPKPQVEEWIGNRGRIPIKRALHKKNIALATGALALVGLLGTAQLMKKDSPTDPLVANSSPEMIVEPEVIVPEASTIPDLNRKDDQPALAALSPPPVYGPEASSDEPATPDPVTASSGATPNADKQKALIANQEDEMWRIAVENAEFFLLSNDGDPAPWIRTARKIAAGFNSSDSRLARTYFLAALLEPDFRVAEQQFNRALNIQTKSLGLYHAETAQTLEALAWIAEHNKDDLNEAITHQRLAINIYHDIFGEEAEDTRAAQWKLEYFEERLAGIRPKSTSNRRLLPALARFTR